MIDPAFVVAAAVNRAQGVALSVASFEGGSSVDARMIPPAKVQSSCLYDARVLLQGDCFDEVLVKARRLDKEGGGAALCAVL